MNMFRFLTLTMLISITINFSFATPQIAVQYWDDASSTVIEGTWELFLADGTPVSGPHSTGATLVDLTLNESYKIKANVSAGVNSKSFIYWGYGNPTHHSLWYEFTPLADQVFVKHAYYLEKNNSTFTSTDDVEIWIHDPWITDENDEPYGQDHFIPLSDLSTNGDYSVFWGRGYNINNLQYPYYKVRVKRLTSSSSSILVFNSISNINIQVEVFDPQNDWDEEYFAELGVIFNNEEILDLHVNYDAENLQSNNPITINIGESLVIPAGADIYFSMNVTISCYGNLVVGDENGLMTYLGSPAFRWHGINVEPSGSLIMENTTISETIGIDAFIQGAIIINSTDVQNCQAHISGSTFLNNIGKDIFVRGGIHDCTDPEPIVIENCSFNSLDIARSYVVAIIGSDRNVRIDNCTFTHSRKAIYDGGCDLVGRGLRGLLEVYNSTFIHQYSEFDPGHNLEISAPAITLGGVPSAIIQNNEFINALDDDVNPHFPISENTNFVVDIWYYDHYFGENIIIPQDYFDQANTPSNIPPEYWDFPNETRIPAPDCVENPNGVIKVENNTAVQYYALTNVLVFEPDETHNDLLSIRNNILYSPEGQIYTTDQAPNMVLGANILHDSYLDNFILDYNDYLTDFFETGMFIDGYWTQEGFVSTYLWTASGDNDITDDPLLVNPIDFVLNQWPFGYDNSLLFESPCINTGDPNLEDDTDGSVADMGFLENPATLGHHSGD